jgi:hypothetical protein
MRHPDAYRPTRAGVRRVFDTEKSLDQYEAALRRAVHTSE